MKIKYSRDADVLIIQLREGEIDAAKVDDYKADKGSGKSFFDE